MLVRDLGKHIFENHLDCLFSGDNQNNRNKLWFSGSQDQLPEIEFKEGRLYWCLGCKAIVRRRCYRDTHLDNDICKKNHTQEILKLREKYPKSGATTEPVVEARSDLAIQLKRVQQLINTYRNIIHRYHACLSVHRDEIKLTYKDEEFFDITNDLLIDEWKETPHAEKQIKLLSDFVALDDASVRKAINPKDTWVADLYRDAREYKDELDDEKEKKEPEPESEPEPEPERKPDLTPQQLLALENIAEVPAGPERAAYASTIPWLRSNINPVFVEKLNALLREQPKEPEPEPEKPKSTPQIFGSKRRPKSERTLPPVAPPPPEPEKPKPKPLPPAFNPQSYITIPEPPKLPTILQTTKR